MANTSIQITLPEPAMSHLNAAVASGEFESPDEYLTFLLQGEADAQEELEHRLLASLDNLEDSVTFTPEQMERGEILALLKKDAGFAL